MGAALLLSFCDSSAFFCLEFILPCDTIFSMETSDKITDKCSLWFCHQLPFQVNEAREANGGTLPQPVPLASVASGLQVKPHYSKHGHLSPLCSPAHIWGKEISELPAIPCTGTVSILGNSLVFVKILAFLCIHIVVTCSCGRVR